MKLLKYEGKHSTDLYDISTPEKEAAAYLALFKFMNDYNFYDYDLTKIEKFLYRRAVKGDVNATKEFLELRSEYEYEGIEVIEAIDATKI